VIASKFSGNHFISEKYKNSAIINKHFLKNAPLVLLHTSASDSKAVGSIPGSNFVKASSALTPHS
jgi:hypothetical protein